MRTFTNQIASRGIDATTCQPRGVVSPIDHRSAFAFMRHITVTEPGSVEHHSLLVM